MARVRVSKNTPIPARTIMDFPPVVLDMAEGHHYGETVESVISMVIDHEKMIALNKGMEGRYLGQVNVAPFGEVSLIDFPQIRRRCYLKPEEFEWKG